jgi:pimeloyl-ACP methyl ester carboxylesterase
LLEKKLRINDRECQAIVSKHAGTPILFLHGFSYTSDIWRKIGLLDILAEKKISFLALDMPYGKKSQCMPRSSDPETNETFALEAFKSEFGPKMPFAIVGASLGGYIALRIASRRPAAALLLVSPTRTDRPELVQAYKSFNFPVVIVWGTRDIIVSGKKLREMTSQLPDARMSVYEGASHSAYKDQPERFSKELLELYGLARRKPGF